MSKAKDTEGKVPFRQRKHYKLKVTLIVIAVIIALLAGGLSLNHFANQNFTVSFYQITSDKVSSNIRIVELSDLHNSEYGEKNSKLIAKIESLDPDIIVYAGDMMNEQDSNYSVLFDLSDMLTKIAPVYACYGNNELDQQLFYDNQFANQLKEHGVNLISNEKVDVEIGSSVVQLIAISDNAQQFDVSTNNAKRFLETLAPTDNCRICLTHYPELFNEKLLNRGIDIAFTGHAHGGHVRLPYIGGLYSTGEGFLPRFTEGVVTVDDGAQVVVSRGLGNSSEATGIKWLEIPRINNPPELVVVDICWY